MASGLLQVSDWADVIYDFVRTYGLTDTVHVVDELSSGDDVTGTGVRFGSYYKSGPRFGQV